MTFHGSSLRPGLVRIRVPAISFAVRNATFMFMCIATSSVTMTNLTKQQLVNQSNNLVDELVLDFTQEKGLSLMPVFFCRVKIL